VLGRVAIGGMAEIFLARETLPGGAVRQTALKVIKRAPSSPKDAEYFEELFLREGRTVVQLAHPHICHVYDIGREDDQFFIAMEWIEGRALTDVLNCLAAQGERIPPALAVGIAAQVASALECAHNTRDARGKRLNVVHRDVNPQNIMLRYDGVVKLVDFGVAQVSAEVDSRAGALKGKPAYMAPEQLRSGVLDARTDVFALGICLYEMVSGRRLHKRPSLQQTLLAVLQEPPPSLSALVPDISPELDAIVQRALSKQPEDRYASAGEFQGALEGFLAAQGQIGSARRMGELMTRLYPSASKARAVLDTSQEVTSSFSAHRRSSLPVRKRPLGVLLLLAFALPLLGWGAVHWLSHPSAEAAGKSSLRADPVPNVRDPSASKSSSGTDVALVRDPSAPAGANQAAAQPAVDTLPDGLAIDEVEPAASTPNSREKPVEAERPKRRRPSPGFVADPGF
jgi:serine/threonine-protein kinase